MKVPARSARSRAFLFVALLGVASLVVISTFGASQSGKALQPKNDPSDKRNRGTAQSLGEIYGSNPANDCWKHHEGEGMRDTVIVYPMLPTQLQVGQKQEISVFIINPWKQELEDMSLFVTLKGDDPVLAVEAKQSATKAVPPDLHFRWEGILGQTKSTNQATEALRRHQGNVSLPFEIPRGASHLFAFVEFRPTVGSTPADPDGYTATFRYSSEAASSTSKKFEPGDFDNRTVAKRSYFLESPGAGRGFFEIEHRYGSAVEVEYYVNATVVMGGVAGAGGERTYEIPIPKDIRILAVNKGGEPYEVKVPIVPFKKGTQPMEFMVRAGVYYKHQDPTTPNLDYYRRYQNLSAGEDLVTGNTIIPTRHAVVGDTFIPSAFGVATPKVEDQWQFVLAETSGFAAAGLLLPSLLLGGTYGKGSRRFFNNLLGGAKRRVMFHNLSSLGLSLVAVVHILLFLYEIRYTVAMGVLWGGLGALSLLVLGLTGYYQVPLIQRHGYKWWRNTHLVFGLLVVVFVAYHMIADGPDFFFIKERLPAWLNDINLAQR